MKVNRINILSKYGGHCAYCGCFVENETMQVDHIIPKYLGGTDTEENYNPSCRKCNHYKDTFTIEKFRNELSLQLERLQKNNNFILAKKYGQIETTPSRIIFYFERWNKTY